MNRHVVGALHERGIDREKGFQSLRRETAGKKSRVLFRDADIEVTRRMLGLEKSQARSARHRRGDCNNLLIRVRELREGLAHQLRIGRRRRRRRLPALDLVFAEAVEFVRLRDRGLVAFAFLGQNMEQDRLVLRLEKFERADQQRNVVAVNRSVITQPKLFENYARHDQANSLCPSSLEAPRRLTGVISKLLNCTLHRSQRLAAYVSASVDDAVKVIGNRADVFSDRPFVVVQHNDESLRLHANVVQRLVTDPAGERRVARHHHHILVAASQIAPDCHSQSGGERGPGVPRTVTIVLAFRAQEKSVQSLVLPHRADPIEPAGKHFVDVTLMAHVEDKSVFRRFENAMERDR